MNSEEEKNSLIFETFGHVRQLKERISDLKCETESSEHTLSLIIDDNSGIIDKKVAKDLDAIDNLLHDVTLKLRIKDVILRKGKKSSQDTNKADLGEESKILPADILDAKSSDRYAFLSSTSRYQGINRISIRCEVNWVPFCALLKGEENKAYFKDQSGAKQYISNLKFNNESSIIFSDEKNRNLNQESGRNITWLRKNDIEVTGQRAFLKEHPLIVNFTGE